MKQAPREPRPVEPILCHILHANGRFAVAHLLLSLDEALTMVAHVPPQLSKVSPTLSLHDAGTIIATLEVKP